MLENQLRAAVDRLNPAIPAAAKEDAVKQVLDLGIPAQLAAYRYFHKLLVGGVPVQYQKEGETRGDFVRLIDWANPQENEWLAVNSGCTSTRSAKRGWHRSGSTAPSRYPYGEGA